MRPLYPLLLIVGLALSLTLVSCADERPVCDCAEGEVCQAGACMPANRCPEVACPTGRVCEGGECVREPACATDDECPGGRCVEGGCYAVECEEGDEEIVACGRCGTTQRQCRDRVWITPEPCADEGECHAGATEDGPCGMGTRTCSETCAWSEWEGRGEACEANTVAEEACGACGVRTRACDGLCVWGEWSECDEEAGCTPGEKQTQPCGTDAGACVAGTQERVCGDDCVFGDWGACAGEVPPTDEVCGDGIDQDCDGQDLAVPDEYEPNNTCATAHYIGDNPNPGNAFDLYPNFHDASDRDDYFFFTFQDDPRTDLTEHIQVSLSIPPGHKTQLFLYASRADCLADNPAVSSYRSNDGDDFELVTYREDRNVDESGNWYIRIRQVEGTSCGPTSRFMRVQ